MAKHRKREGAADIDPQLAAAIEAGLQPLGGEVHIECGRIEGFAESAAVSPADGQGAWQLQIDYPANATLAAIRDAAAAGANAIAEMGGVGRFRVIAWKAGPAIVPM